MTMSGSQHFSTSAKLLKYCLLRNLHRELVRKLGTFLQNLTCPGTCCAPQPAPELAPEPAPELAPELAPEPAPELTAGPAPIYLEAFPMSSTAGKKTHSPIKNPSRQSCFGEKHPQFHQSLAFLPKTRIRIASQVAFRTGHRTSEQGHRPGLAKGTGGLARGILMTSCRTWDLR